MVIKKNKAKSPCVTETPRLTLRQLTVDDAAFILQLVNEPSWLQFIGDKGVKTLEDAENFIESGPLQMYKQLGHGMYLIELKRSSIPIGMCGLIKRDLLPDVDLGFALLPEFWGQGYAFEAASNVISYGKTELGLLHLLAITDQNNQSSSKLLEKLGFLYSGLIHPEPNGEAIRLYDLSLQPGKP